MLRIGMFLGGRYEILEHIGSGGMSDVYKAKCHKLNRLVAIKVLKEEFHADNSFVAKFKAEAQASACLSHPNIVNVYDVGDEAGIHYIVMELVEGITLKRHIAKKGHLEVRETIGIAVQVAQGLEAAHEQKIIHRDIKPQNIIISKEGKVKVTDFGIARAVSTQTISSSAMGSVHYISPEQARGGYCDERSDIYSLGVTIYEMLTGRVPFEGETAVAVAMLNPNEDFVKIIPLVRNDAPTMVMSDDEMNKIKEGSRKVTLDEEDSKAEQNYLLGLEDEEDLDPDGEEEVEEEEEDVSSRFDKIFTGVLIGIAVLVVILVVFICGKLFGLFGGGNKLPTDASSSSAASEDMTEMPDLLGKTLKEAEQLLKEHNLGKYVAYAFSDEYDEGQVMAFGTGEYDGSDFKPLKEGDSIKKHTTITIVLSSGKSMVTIPSDIIGKTESEAKTLLTNAGFTNIVVEEGASDTVDAGKVYKCSPSAGKQAPVDGEVIIYVSTGPETKMVKVPNLVGEWETDVDAILAEYGLKGSATTAHSDTVAEGQVISQKPAKGTEVEEGSTITYVVSLGKETKKTTVPNLLGSTRSGAEKLLKDSKLAVGTVTEDYSDEYAAGKVMSQEISAGNSINEGTTISFVISKGSKPKPTEPTPDPEPENPDNPDQGDGGGNQTP